MAFQKELYILNLWKKYYKLAQKNPSFPTVDSTTYVNLPNLDGL